MSELPDTPHIVKLDATHARDTFDCGKPKLNDYLRTLASQHQKRGIGRTFVLASMGTTKVLGFYTLAASSLSFEHVPAHEKIPRYPVPVVKLARLALDNSAQKKGYGALLLFDALVRTERISREIAVFAVEVDAMDQEALSFYLKYDFSSLNDDTLHLYLPMKKIMKLHLND